MIFCSKNELGVVKANWIASLPVGTRFVTRRSKVPRIDLPTRSNSHVRKSFAVCPNRGKKAVCRAGYIGLERHSDWLKRVTKNPDDTLAAFLIESRLEGFTSVSGWLGWYPAHKIDINNTFRIEMERV